jgi:hypothetical protein
VAPANREKRSSALASLDLRFLLNAGSTERRSTDLEAAFDRLAARTGNLRVIRPRERVG